VIGGWITDSLSKTEPIVALWGSTIGMAARNAAAELLLGGT
jgi:hypothetical protein